MSISGTTDDGIRYCKDVVSGKILNCQYIRQACQRQLDDMERQNTPGFPYIFKPELGTRYIRFIEKLKHTSGEKASRDEFFILEDWQKWIIGTAYSWVFADGHPNAGARRFNRVFILCGRGQGKSILNSAICLASLVLDGTTGGQVVCCAKNALQSKIVLSEAQQMVRKSPELMRAMGVTLTAHEIHQNRTHSKMYAISADRSGSADGRLPSTISMDELHAFADRSTYDAMELALAKRKNSNMWIITTAGESTGTVCWEVFNHVTQILKKTVIDENTLGVIYTIDPEMDWRDPRSWACANPNLNVSIVESTIAQLCLKAQTVVSAQNSFKCKHLGIWSGSEASWMDMDAWRKTKDPNLSISAFVGKKCWIGVDAATTTDICAKVYLFPELIRGETHYTVFTTAYLPRAAVQESRNAAYSGWEIMGALTVTEGDVVDFQRLEDDLIEDARNFHVMQVGYDPWQFSSSSQRLVAQGAPMIEVRPNVANFSAPMKFVDALTRQNLIHSNCPVLDYCIGNTVCVYDRNDNIFPRKLGNRPENKIDLVVAMLTAMTLAMHEEDTTSIYETRELLIL